MSNLTMKVKKLAPHAKLPLRAHATDSVRTCSLWNARFWRPVPSLMCIPELP